MTIKHRNVMLGKNVLGTTVPLYMDCQVMLSREQILSWYLGRGTPLMKVGSTFQIVRKAKTKALRWEFSIAIIVTYYINFNTFIYLSNCLFPFILDCMSSFFNI